MKTDKPHDTMLKERLRQTYFEKERLTVGDRWQADAMRRIRQLGPEDKPATGFLAGFETFVWRLTPVVCVLLLVLTTVWMNVDFVPEFDVFQALYEDADPSMLQTLLN